MTSLRTSAWEAMYRPIYVAAYHRRDFDLFINGQNYLADDHRRDFRVFFIYTDRITSPLIIGEILVSSLYRQN